jgi:LacI family transcriptional regulator
LNCPEDISITGFNDTPMIDRIPPGLTTIRILQFDVGRIAAEFLLKKMNESGLPIPETTIMPVTIVNRGSVADLN